jgi:hypothetical protein
VIMRAICTTGWQRTLRTKPYKTPLNVLLTQNIGVDCRLPTPPPTAEKATPPPTPHNAEKATPLRGLAKHYEQLSATGAGLPFVVFACL